MKVLITGSCGFIGFSLSKSLLKKGYSVIGIDNFSDFYDVNLKIKRNKLLEHKNYSFLNLSLNDLDNLKVDNIDLAINLAAQPGVRVSKEKQHLYMETNVKGFISFCNFCEKNLITKIIYASSSSVYSDIHIGKYCEDSTKLEPKSEYGVSKLKNEIYAEEFSRNTKSNMIGLRFFSVYGPFGRPDMAYFSFTNSLKKNLKITLNNYGKMQRDMTYIDDVVNGIKGAINLLNSKKQKIKQNEIINLGNDKPISTSELLSKLEAKLGKKSEVVHLNTKNEAFFTHADITKAKKLLGYNPIINIDEGIARFLKWHQEYDK